jgi:hypothetical protein
MRGSPAVVPGLIFLVLCACGNNEMKKVVVDLTDLRRIPQEKWNALSSKRIFFGHQSVGNNILDGIRKIQETIPGIGLRLVETKERADFSKPVFAHARIGENEDPISKIEDFRKTLDSGLGGAIDIALMKLCYIDINRDTDIERILKKYDQMVTELKGKYPNLRLLHSTVPLRVRSMTLASRIKRLLGLSSPSDEDNVRRNEINRALRSRFGKNDLFDLAEVESTYPDGARVSFEKNGQTYEALVPEYSDDGGHLDDLGRTMLAKQFLMKLIQVPQ